MEMSASIGQTKTTKYLHPLAILAGTLLLGVGSFAVLISAFHLTYSIGNWNRGGLLGGFLKTCNDIADGVGTSSYTLLRQYGGASNEGGLFLTFLLLLLLLFAYLVMRSRNLWLGALYLIPLVILPLAFRCTPSGLSVLLLGGGLALLLMHHNLKERFGLAALCITAVVLVVTGIFALTGEGQKILSPSATLKSLGSTFEQKVDATRYGTNPLGDGTFQEGSWKSSDTALTVTMEEPQAMYLRGFVGEQFSGDTWKSLKTETHYQSRSLMAGLADSDFNVLGQLADAAKLGGTESKETKVTIKVKNASRRYVYVPYEITARKVPHTKNWSGAFLTGRGMTGQDSYSYQTAGNLTGIWTDVTGKLYSTSYSKDFATYTAAESHYNRFVYENYTALDEGTMKTLREEIGSRGNQEKGHVGYKTAISKVLTYFNTNLIFSQKGNQGKDKLSLLFQKKKGNDADFATAATLMFRYYGIPARYVEGYLVTSEDAEAMTAGKSQKISMARAHAWTEIYVDGVGWIPLETSDTYQKWMPQADLSKGLETESGANPFDQLERGSTGELITKEKDPKPWQIPWAILGLIALALLLVLLGIWFYRVGFKKLQDAQQERKAIRQEDVRGGICALFGYAQRRNLPLSEQAQALGLAAGYSTHPMQEADRQQMREAVTQAKKEQRVQKRKDYATAIQRKLRKKE